MEIDAAAAPCCAVCDESRRERFSRWYAGEIDLYRCGSCGFVFQHPFLPEWTAVGSRDDLDFTRDGSLFKYPRRGRVLQDIVTRLGRLEGSGRLLDVGCGDGHFLSLCAKAGYDCAGVEPRRELAGHAARVSGAEVIGQMYSDSLFSSDSLDILTMIQVLEHMERPRDILRAAWTHLRRDGLLVVEVPSITAPHFLAYRMTGVRWFVRPPTGVIRPHFAYYSPWVLRDLAERCGFRTVSLVTGRWQFKYDGMLRAAGRLVDPLLSAVGIGGILYCGRKV